MVAVTYRLVVCILCIFVFVLFGTDSLRSIAFFGILRLADMGTLSFLITSLRNMPFVGDCCILGRIFFLFFRLLCIRMLSSIVEPLFLVLLVFVQAFIIPLFKFYWLLYKEYFAAAFWAFQFFTVENTY